ncbi:hypothetical protein WEN_03200 [Mycoplasma wenyonii str. Massachusetts]|uniref:Uncharacterized protein n=1 Tax=Mycoplasma wenyonii (strain Massachusetts) TaxID=1197325 RepID=I6YM85_MYCWM|nr:hypothetical protein WEN_03200 [Mycoplasma wenyonii str. Massachusetts]
MYLQSCNSNLILLFFKKREEGRIEYPFFLEESIIFLISLLWSNSLMGSEWKPTKNSSVPIAFM